MADAPPPSLRRNVLLCGSLLAGVWAASLCGCRWAANGQNASGVQKYEQGHYAAAMQEFQKAIATDAANPDGYYNLAATTHRMGTQRQDRALLEQAEALYNQCLDHDPHHVDCRRGLAVLLVESGRPDRAFALLKNWAADNPRMADPRIELARLYEEYGEPHTAKKYLEDAVQQDPNNSRAWLAMARMREAAGDYSQALANYQRSYSLNTMQPMVQERIAALNRKLADGYDLPLSGRTQMAQPGVSGGRY